MMPCPQNLKVLTNPRVIQNVMKLNQREKRDRYIDIVNVHAAALNSSAVQERQYRSHEDTMDKDGNNDNSVPDLMEAYGLRDRQQKGNDNESYGSDDDGYFAQLKEGGNDQQALSETEHY